MNIDELPSVEFSALLGEHTLDGVDSETIKVEQWKDYFEDSEVFRFRLDGQIYAAVEDPSDGYRSSMKKLILAEGPIRNAFAPVRVLVRLSSKGDYGQVNDTLEMLDMANGKTILRVGTDNTDDYYPWFVSEWTPQNLAVNHG